MNTYRDVAQLWDFSNPANFSQLPEDDFIALLQKQYAKPSNLDAVNPQNISNLLPSSEESSPSPPNSHHDASGGDDSHDPAPKRKASDGGLEEGGPNQKAQHTSNGNKKGSSPTMSVTSRRKSTGSGSLTNKDESRLLKRKEQNRAAQRAFRERKEKHVKDLEDKVADLEAKNERTQAENDNLRDLLTRLQTENVILKQQHQQAPFTFSMPKNTTGGLETQNRMTGSFVEPSLFTPSSATSSQAATVIASPISPSKYSNPLDWTSLTTFDPSVLNVLDESPPQATATTGAMGMDFGFGTSSDALPGFPYTTIASNPAFFSLAATFDSVTSPQPDDLTSTTSPNNSFNFDFNALTPWPTSNQTVQDQSFSELFNSYPPSSNTAAYDPFVSNPPDVRPVDSSSTSSSSASTASSPSDVLRTPVMETDLHSESKCPKSKDACQKAIEESGPSPFAPPSQLHSNTLTTALKKTLDDNSSPMVSCSGSRFPKTQKNDKNIEVLTAWRTIRSHPKFKDVDVNDLCAEFSAKARCDGTKVVLEPQGVDHILETIAKK